MNLAKPYINEGRDIRRALASGLEDHDLYLMVIDCNTLLVPVLL